nr:MAG TPA: hypothetical protein [Bacteriophage sp.]
MKSAVKRSILKKQRWGNFMKLSDIMVLLGAFIFIVSIEIIACVYVVGWVAMWPFLGLDIMLIGFLLLE